MTESGVTEFGPGDLIVGAIPRMVRVGSMRLVVITICLSACLLSGCDDGLGSCDESTVMAAEASGTLIGKCTTCHSSSLTGDARAGAPAGLDFDSEGGRAKWAEEMWIEIDTGRMPPPAPAGSGELSAAEKDAMRGWLACGAPSPDFGDAGMCDDASAGGCEDSWESLWAEISTGGGCAVCHTVGSATIGGGAGFEVMGDACAARDNLLSVAPVGPDCGSGVGDNYIVAGDADGSLLVQKLRGDAGLCGESMPPGGSLPAALIERLVTWIDAGAAAPECP